MRPDHPPTDLRERFQDALHVALITGSPPPRSMGLGPQSLAAVTLIAAEHPYATAEDIAAAFDAFLNEHKF